MTRHLNADLPPELIERWRADRAAGLSLQRIALRDGVSDWTVRRYTMDVVVPKRIIKPKRTTPREISQHRPVETRYPEPEYAEVRPVSRLRAKLAAMRAETDE